MGLTARSVCRCRSRQSSSQNQYEDQVASHALPPFSAWTHGKIGTNETKTKPPMTLRAAEWSSSVRRYSRRKMLLPP